MGNRACVRLLLVKCAAAALVRGTRSAADREGRREYFVQCLPTLHGDVFCDDREFLEKQIRGNLVLSSLSLSMALPRAFRRVLVD
jgi:hypothetical protein